MGLLGSIVGGALQGLGSGMVKDAQARRDAALEATREAAEAQRQAAQQAAQTAAQTQRDATLHKYDQENAADKAVTDQDKLRVAGEIDASKAAQQHVYKLGEIKTEQVGRTQLAVLQSRLDTAKDAASIRLKDQLASGDISTVVRGKDGQYYGVTDKGLVATGVQAALTSGEAESGGGGRLSEAEQGTAFSQALSDWRASGADPKTKPKASDFIGMTHQDYYTKYHGGSGDVTPAASAGTPQSSAGSSTATAKATPVEQALTRLANTYDTLTPQNAPNFFRNGKKLPMTVIANMIRQAGEQNGS